MAKEIITVIILAYLAIGAFISIHTEEKYTKKNEVMKPLLKLFYILLWLPWGFLKFLGWFFYEFGRMGSMQK